MKKSRLDALLSQRGYCSRRESISFLRHNQVEIDGVLIAPNKGETKADPSQVRVNGEPLDPEALYLLMHKPAGVT